jgi:hypothetical protein
MVDNFVDSELILSQDTGIKSGIIQSSPAAPTGEKPKASLYPTITLVPVPSPFQFEAGIPPGVLRTFGTTEEGVAVELTPEYCEYESNDLAIATVNQSGEVTGVAAGGTLIEVSYAEVPSPGQGVQIALTWSSFFVLPFMNNFLGIGQTQQLDTIEESMGGIQRQVNPALCTFVSADPLIATVDVAGLVTGVAAGGPINITVSHGAYPDVIVPITVVV